MRFRTRSAATQRWDYVVIGAGAAGCVIAGRLSQTMPDARIALIEAGGERLLSPVFAFLMALAVEILIGLVRDGGALALQALVAAGAIGGFSLRELRMRPQDDPQDCT